MVKLTIPGKVDYSHLFIEAKIIDLDIDSTIGVSIKDFPIPIKSDQNFLVIS